jgi:hypothetical protein
LHPSASPSSKNAAVSKETAAFVILLPDAEVRMGTASEMNQTISRADAPRIGSIDHQTLRDWVHRFNAALDMDYEDRHVGPPLKQPD